MWTEKDNGGLLPSTMWTKNFLPNQIMFRMMGYFTLEKWYKIFFLNKNDYFKNKIYLVKTDKHLYIQKNNLIF